MDKITFKDYPNTTTPINSTNLNQIQTNIENAISENTTSISTINNNINGIETNIDNIEADITTIETNIDTIESNATNLTNRVSNLEITKGLPVYIDGYIDCDTTTEYFILTQKNTPNNSFYFVFTFFYGSKTTTSSRTQIAIPYNYSLASVKNTVYLRYYLNNDGGWTTWRLVNS